jgi:hypothetical protein
MIKKAPNYHNLLDTRQVDLLPPSFETISLPTMYNTQDSITRWIYENCKSRFYIGKGIELQDNSVATVVKVGFEDPKEASYFVLACPYLKYQ